MKRRLAHRDLDGRNTSACQRRPGAEFSATPPIDWLEAFRVQLLSFSNSRWQEQEVLR